MRRDGSGVGRDGMGRDGSRMGRDGSWMRRDGMGRAASGKEGLTLHPARLGEDQTDRLEGDKAGDLLALCPRHPAQGEQGLAREVVAQHEVVVHDGEDDAGARLTQLLPTDAAGQRRGGQWDQWDGGRWGQFNRVEVGGVRTVGPGQMGSD